MQEFVTSTLKEMGPAGTAISVLLTAIGGLVAAVVLQYKQGNKVYGYRLAERDTLNKALTDSTIAITAFTKMGDERNKITEDLADSLGRQAVAFGHLSDMGKMQHEALKEEVKDQTKVVGSMSEAIRVNTGIVTDVRNGIIGVQNSVADVKSTIQMLPTRRTR